MRKIFFDFNKISNKRKLTVFGISLVVGVWICIYSKLDHVSSQNVDVTHLFNRTFDSIEKFRLAVVRPRYYVNCKKIIDLDQDELYRAKILLSNLRSEGKGSIKSLDDSNFIFSSSMCNMYRQIRRITSKPNSNNSDRKRNISIGFTILMHDKVEQFERLLVALYHPDHMYCIHVDAKASEVVKQAVKSIASCFDNVFLATKLEYIVYAGFSRLRADLNCMSDLLNLSSLINNHENLMGKRDIRWDYSINMASTEFPLRTNQELNDILTIYNGSNDVEITRRFPSIRIKYSWHEDRVRDKMVKTPKLKQEPPHGYVMIKGYSNCILHRRFVEYAVLDPRANDLLKWAEDTYSPDEWYWSTLQFNTKIFPQSGFKSLWFEFYIDTLARFSGWEDQYECKGMMRHFMCVFSLEDLSHLVVKKHFVANKFLLDFDPIAFQCMEEWLSVRANRNKTTDMNFYCEWIKQHSSLVEC